MSSRLGLVLERGRRPGWLKSATARAISYVIVGLFSAFALMPIVWLVSLASKPVQELMTIPIRLVPRDFSLFANIAEAFKYFDLLTWLRNTVIVAVLLAMSDVLLSSCCGYALAKFRFPGREVLFYFILGTFMISFIVILVPLYIIVKDLGWLNSYMGLMAPKFVSAFSIFFMRQSCLSIPNEYLDAARIDGASELRIYRTVVLPLLRPAVITLVIFRFQWEWDALLWPMIVAGSERLHTLPLGLALRASELLHATTFTASSIFAANLLATIPILLVFLYLRKYFINTMITSGLKL